MNELNKGYISINQQCCCFNMRKVMRAVTQYYDHCLEPVGIRSTQFTLLVALYSTSAKTLTEIANSLVMDRTTLTRNLKPLEKLELISIVSSGDKRSKAYILTEKGREVIERGIPLWEGAQRNITSSIGDDKYQLILGNLKDLLEVTGSHFGESNRF